MIRFRIQLLFLVIAATGHSQYSVTGLVLDSRDKEPLAFVNIIVPGTSIAASTTIDGKFSIASTLPFSAIQLSYVGYELRTVEVTPGSGSLRIYLSKASYNLSEIEVRPGINPAHRIIQKAVENRDKNNPDKITSYTCSEYSKAYYDLRYNTEEVQTKKDSIKSDSLKSGLREFAENSHVMMLESVSERSYLSPGNLHEEVIATKVSGFSDPTFSASATDLQPFSFYDDYFNVVGKDFLNPVSPGSTSRYFFDLRDTILQLPDTVYIIYFRPLKGKKFDGLEGLLYINTNGFAIQNVIASPYEKGLLDIKIQQQYQLVDGRQWFPEQLNYTLVYQKFPSKYMGMKLTGKSYITDVKLDAPLKKKDFGPITVDMASGAAEHDETYWKAHRRDSLDSREKRTYRVMDSIGRKQHFDRTLKILESLLTLQLPVSYISIDLNRIIGLNDYETVRGGIGLHTSDKLSRWFTAGGYAGYGYTDSVAKYGADAKIYFRKTSREYFFQYSYIKDISEPARAQYFYSRNNISRNLLSYRMDFIEQHQALVSFRSLKFLSATVALSTSLRKPHYDYMFRPSEKDPTEVSTAFRNAEFSVKGRYAYKEKLVQSLGQLVADGSDYPVLYFSYTHGFKSQGYGDYNYDKFSIAIQRSLLIRHLGKTNLLLEVGYLNGAVPYPLMFGGNGSSSRGNYIYVENTFQTMGLYEFLSDRYVNLFWSHTFAAPFYRRPRSQPQLVLHSSVGYGTLSNPDRQMNIPFLTMEKGYFESGMFINNILRINYYNVAYIGLGGGAFMRYGPYAYGSQKDNIAYKISLTISF